MTADRGAGCPRVSKLQLIGETTRHEADRLESPLDTATYIDAPGARGSFFHLAVLTLASMAVLPLAARSAAASPAATPRPGPATRILSQTELPDGLHAAMDLRWASGHSVYIALGSGGVVEASLPSGAATAAGSGAGGAIGVLRQVIAGKDRPGGVFLASRLAASSDYLVAAAPVFQVAWRRLDQSSVLEEAFEFVQGVDVRGDRLAVVGVRSDEKRHFAPDGAIGWLGSLARRLSDLQPIVFSATGPGARAMLNCGSFGLGAARFLADGSLLVIPGVQPGAELFDPAGKPVRAWDTTVLGIDTDCAALTAQQTARLAGDYPQRLAWLNQRRTVDSILPLPEGAGVLVRTADRDTTRWELKILHRDGSWTASPVPLTGASAFAHLRGDARDGRLVLLLYEDGRGFRTVARQRLVLAAIG
jgi:hypothetical protein